MLKMKLFYFLLLLMSLKMSAIVCDSNCENFRSCGDCIRYSIDRCVWCSAENHSGSRCQSNEYVLKNKAWCATEVYKPEEKLSIVNDSTWNSGKDGEEIVQLKPQYVKVKASPGGLVNLNMFYKPAVDAPLDVYYLMDNSFTMTPYQDRLKKQAVTIFEELTNLTNNVRLGFGTFIEKPVLPYANPFFNDNVYSFKNHLSLTNDMKQFQLALNVTGGSNYDIPEAVLDGLMQAMVCEEQIGWRKHARRVIVVFTDGLYHSAGDGKAIGAFKVHDMKCHIDGTMDTVMDYPSVSQINKVAQSNRYTILFAVTNAVTKQYQALSDTLIGAKTVSLTDEVNIAQMIKTEYLKMLKEIRVITLLGSKHVQITAEANCVDGCKGLHFQPVNISATFKVLSCPTPVERKLIKLGLTSLNEALTVEMEFDCECDCEKDKSNTNSDKCSKSGTYQCGICKCNPNRYGSDCRCQGDSSSDFDGCKKHENETLYCSGRGECRCGKCEQCSKGFSGPFCEFDDNACARPGGKICSGNGICTMGKCVCLPNWSRDDCGCLTDERACIAPYSKKICSGNGVCQCGQCVCDRLDDPKDQCRGRYCDDCKAFAVKRCDELQEFAYCKYVHNTTCGDTYNQTDTRVIFVNKTEFNSPGTDWYMANLCRIQKEDSIFVFKYYWDTTDDSDNNESKIVLVLQQELEKPEPVNVWVAVGSALGSIVLIGLLSLILWKIITDYYDEREYKQFEKKARAAGYITRTENPWYQPPIGMFINPSYDTTLTN